MLRCFIQAVAYSSNAAPGRPSCPLDGDQSSLSIARRLSVSHASASILSSTVSGAM
jgi:hypothetical protein